MPSGPGRGANFTLVYEWNQDVGTGTACHGLARHTVALASQKQSIGDPDTLRLQGSYRASYTRGEGSTIWHLSPRCDYLACNARLRSNGGLRGTLKLRRDGTYAITDDLAGFGRCVVVNNLTGNRTVFEPAYTRHRLIVLDEGSGSGAIARRFTGRVTDTYRATTAARRAGCTGTTRHLKITLTKR